MPTHTPADGRTFAAILRALASLAVLAAAVAGLPLLLAKVTPVVRATSRDDLTHLLDRQDTGGAFLLLLIAIAWIGWAQFTLCVLREIPAQLRGRTWQAPRGLGSSQRLASVLIGGILVLLPTGTAMASPATAAPATATLNPQQAHPVPASAAAARPAATEADDTAPLYTVRDVRPAESLWSIAEDQLGDGERWRDIAQLNEGRTMGDGSTFHASAFLQPGWQLRMPASPADQEAPAARDERTHETTVGAGDTLWEIAEKEMGDGAKYRQLFEANRGAPQPDGTTLTDPDEIRAGLKLQVPQQAAPASPSKPADPKKPDSGNEDRADTSREPAHDSPQGSGRKEKSPKPPKEDPEEHAGDNRHRLRSPPRPTSRRRPRRPQSLRPLRRAHRTRHPMPRRPSRPSAYARQQESACSSRDA
ncbi:LysM peptidoglycan-binding domain-containing protein [Streptomyces sp. G5(2025)]|uniref:LysM peptidoglycan-binding domain-containing protein n=1 Tax=Streptomyces sp. G5(2025) TaxID=3406628 RepID=UPI003C251A19